VYLDNGYIGVSPLTIPSVTTGSHVVLLTLPGYANWQATVQVQNNLVASVDATLAPAPTSCLPNQAFRRPLPPSPWASWQWRSWQKGTELSFFSVNASSFPHLEFPEHKRSDG